MPLNLFYSSSSLDNIRFNVIILHAIALLLGGVYLIYAVLQHDDIAIRSQLIPGLLTLGFGLLNILAARAANHKLISASLVIWFVLLIYQSFNVIDPTQAAIGINMALLSLIVLVTIYYSSIAGLSILVLITMFNFYRIFAIEHGFISPMVSANTGLFETNVLAILNLYSCAIAGYYQYQSQRYLNALEVEKNALVDAITELRYKEKSIREIIDDAQKLSNEKLPVIKGNIQYYLDIINSEDEQDFKQFLNSGDNSMKQIDTVLRSIDEQIKVYDDAK